MPRVHGAQSIEHAPGLHFVGIDIMLSGLLRDVGREARAVGHALANHAPPPDSAITRQDGVMDYRLMGRSGCSVSTLALGTMTFGTETDEDGSHAQLEAFVAAVET